MAELQQNKFRFHEVADAPAESGIYAWYCRYELPRRDITDFIDSLEAETLPTVRRRMVEHFLTTYLLRFFAETPYVVSLDGPLKPRYRGQLHHLQSVSESLLDRIIAEPERLFSIAAALTRSMPYFASPLYIGSAKCLKTRLQQHVHLMTQYRERSMLYNSGVHATSSSEVASDHSFAHETIAIRRFDPNDLWVYALPMKLGAGHTFDIENILNRINYPLCGRN